MTDYPHVNDPPGEAKRERTTRLLALLQDKGRIIYRMPSWFRPEPIKTVSTFMGVTVYLDKSLPENVV